ncbi:MAG: hypothetical protein GXP31_10910 [Kiritimatiellaeota bacterium]|nr:hypothetical protein [Kiritimatiellota bacterium]
MNDLVRFLHPADAARRVWITDFDGVLHRGLAPRWTQGISNAEFGLAYCARHAKCPARFLQIARGLGRVSRLRTRLERKRQSGDYTLGETEALLLRCFVEHVLRPGLPVHVRPAAEWTVRFCDPDALVVLRGIRDRTAAVAVLSKAFAPVLAAAADRIAAECGRKPICHGIPLEYSPECRIRESDAIVTGADKARCVRQLLAGRSEWTSAVCVGDTEEDVPLFGAVREVLGRKNVLCIALPARDAAIGSAADVCFRSWAQVRQTS